MSEQCAKTVSGEQLSKQLVGHYYFDDDSGILVGRSTQFGNPFRLHKDGGSYTRAESVEAYEDWLVDKIASEPAFRDAVRQLAGEKLDCYCQQRGENGPACHAEVLCKHALYLANSEGAE